jgi:hypothetical protein
MKIDRSSSEPYRRTPPCSNTGEQGRHEEISDGDPAGGRDLDGTGRGVLASLDEGLPSAEGERERLMPLLSSIGEIFISHEASRRYGNGRTFDSRAPT